MANRRLTPNFIDTLIKKNNVETIEYKLKIEEDDFFVIKITSPNLDQISQITNKVCDYILPMDYEYLNGEYKNLFLCASILEELSNIPIPKKNKNNNKNEVEIWDLDKIEKLINVLETYDFKLSSLPLFSYLEQIIDEKLQYRIKYNIYNMRLGRNIDGLITTTKELLFKFANKSSDFLGKFDEADIEDIKTLVKNATSMYTKNNTNTSFDVGEIVEEDISPE